MRKNGFTLVELLAVLIILALLIAIAVPSALKIAGNVKNKSYEAKVDMIEAAAKNYGQSNLSSVQNGYDNGKYGECKFGYKDGEITSVVYTGDLTSSTGVSKGCESDSSCTYWCISVNVSDLVSSGNLDWDNEAVCDSNVQEGCTKDYQNTIINPKTKDILNKCKVYIYYKNKRVYAYYDRTACDQVTAEPNAGHAYPSKF